MSIQPVELTERTPNEKNFINDIVSGNDVVCGQSISQ